MKLFKKTAALLFCLALIVGVMAVSASADDEAELLGWENGVLMPDVNPEFTVMLTKSATNDATVTSRDGVDGYEIEPTTDVTFDITVAYNHSSGTYNFENKTIDGFQFNFVPENNYGATISGATVNRGTSTTASYSILHTNTSNLFSTNSVNTYGYSAGGTTTDDIPLPDSGALALNDAKDTVTNGTTIGTITLSFETATQAIDIYPQIENLLIHVRDGGTDAAQQPVAASTSVSYNNANPATPHGAVSGGKAPSSGNQVDPPASSNFHSCVIVAPVPVIVNPVYNVKLESFTPDPNTGILAKTMTTDTTPVPATTNYKYDFITGSFQTGSDYKDSGNYPTRLSNANLPGYTLQGWMVTDNTDTSNTWADYAYGSLYPAWNEDTSYPATTTAMTGQLTWADAADTWYSAANNVGRVEFNGSYVYGNSTQSGVNFIPVTRTITVGNETTTSDYTYFPAGLVGDITLTPVYTRNVYTATFNSGDDDATFDYDTITTNVNASATKANENDTTVATFTMEYTIEDLYDSDYWTLAYDKTHVVDFLVLNDTTSGPAGPWGAKRTAYKFMGWTPADSTPAPDSGYSWTRDNDLDDDSTGDELVDVSAYNAAQVLKTANCKHDGNVTFTAVWEEDIYYAEVGYWYGGSDNVLVLVAVPSAGTVISTDTPANYDANYTYLFNPSADASAQKMFLVPDSDQRTAYVNFALTEADRNGSSDYTSLEKFSTDITSADSYVLFAYIAEGNNVDQASVTIDENETTYTSGCANDTLSYNGNVDGTGAITVADFGNVDTLFNDATSSNANVFNITNYYGVRSRLQSDVTTNTEESGKKFASISDIKFIYDLMGYNTNT